MPEPITIAQKKYWLGMAGDRDGIQILEAIENELAALKANLDARLAAVERELADLVERVSLESD